jgi:four helix bundle protein
MAVRIGVRSYGMQDFKKLRVSTHARAVIRATYRFTAALPREEQFGLTAQMRRAAVSIGLNIAEGCSRNSTREFIRFLEVARGSGMELEFAIVVTEDLTFGQAHEREALVHELLQVQRQLSALIAALRRRLVARTRL